MSGISKQALIIAANRNGWALLDDTDQWQHRIQIRSSSSDLLYIVAQNKRSGEWGCSCPGWKSRRHCKHLANMLPSLRQLTDQRGR